MFEEYMYVCNNDKECVIISTSEVRMHQKFFYVSKAHPLTSNTVLCELNVMTNHIY